MSATRKFAFETVFSEDGQILREASGFKVHFTREELEAARAEAFEAGVAAESLRLEREMSAALAALCAQARTALSHLDSEARALRAEAADAALIAARTIAGAALDRFGDVRVLAAIEEAMEALRSAPRLLIRLAPGSAAQLRERIESAGAEHGFSGALIVREDAAFAPGDLALDWSDGRIVHARADVIARIESILEDAKHEAGAPP